MNKFKTIIPNLVSIETNISKLNGFIMCQDFTFYNGTDTKYKYHYKLVETNKINVPKDYDLRSEYYVKKGNSWYYDRKIFFWHPYFQYDYINKILYYNKAYLLLPTKIGGLFTLGEHLSNIIDFDMFLDGIACLRGIAITNNNKTIGICAPGLNGKSTLLSELLISGVGYIAEDYLVVDFKNNWVYPTCPLLKGNLWQHRKIVNKLNGLTKNNNVINTPSALDCLYFVHNSQNNTYHSEKKSLIDSLLLNSLYFLDNLLIKSFIYDLGLASSVFTIINNLNKTKIKHKHIQIYNYKYQFIN